MSSFLLDVSKFDQEWRQWIYNIVLRLVNVDESAYWECYVHVEAVK